MMSPLTTGAPDVALLKDSPRGKGSNSERKKGKEDRKERRCLLITTPVQIPGCSSPVFPFVCYCIMEPKSVLKKTTSENYSIGHTFKNCIYLLFSEHTSCTNHMGVTLLEKQEFTVGEGRDGSVAKMFLSLHSHGNS